jgi:predicted lipid-binding transport protein (Tim44 family)
MGLLPHYFDIVLFAMIAVFLILRLRSVLGRRTGNERPPQDSWLRRAQLPRPGKPASKPTNNIVAFGNRPGAPAPLVTAAPSDATAAGLENIRAVDQGFDPANFLDGARHAFEMIVAAFAAGDKAALRPLLSDEVYRPFAAAIDERALAGETLETRIVHLKNVDIVDAGMAGRNARVTVKFVSDQIHVLRAHDGSIVDGDPEHPIEKTDFWTFMRDVRSADPNWVLVTTSSG